MIRLLNVTKHNMVYGLGGHITKALHECWLSYQHIMVITRDPYLCPSIKQEVTCSYTQTWSSVTSDIVEQVSITPPTA